MKENELCVMPRGLPHGETPVDTRTSYRILVVTWNPQGFTLHYAVAGAERRVEGIYRENVESLPAQRAFAWLDHAAESQHLPQRVRSRLQHALVEAFCLTLLAAVEDPPPLELVQPPLVAQARALMRTKRADPDWTVTQTARHLGFSAGYLSRTYQRMTGHSLRGFLNEERVRLACDLLRTTPQHIGEIAWNCGFRQSSYFIRVFRLHTGQTPRAFRLQQGQEMR